MRERGAEDWLRLLQSRIRNRTGTYLGFFSCLKNRLNLFVFFFFFPPVSRTYPAVSQPCPGCTHNKKYILFAGYVSHAFCTHTHVKHRNFGNFTIHVLGALRVADDGMRNEGAWVALGQSLGFMFSQHTYGSSCLTNNAPKGSLRGTCLVSLLELDR